MKSYTIDPGITPSGAAEGLNVILSKLSKVRRKGNQWKALCPAHDDVNPSLSIRQAEDGKILLHCFAGCSYRDVAAALGIPTGSRAGDVASEVRAALALFLDEIDYYTLRGKWRGTAAHTDRSVLRALVRYASKYGTVIPAGVLVSISVRQLALEAGVSRRTAHRSVARLRGQKPGVPERASGQAWISRDPNRDRRLEEAGSFVLRLPGIPRAAHSDTTYTREVHGYVDGVTMRGPEERDYDLDNFLAYESHLVRRRLEDVPALRWGGLGKKCESVLRVLVARIGAATIKEIADDLGDNRPRDLLRNSPKRAGALVKLQQHGIVEIRGDVVELTHEWRMDLDLARGLLGEHARASADFRRYEKERDDYADYLADRGYATERQKKYDTITALLQMLADRNGAMRKLEIDDALGSTLWRKYLDELVEDVQVSVSGDLVELARVTGRSYPARRRG